MPVIKFRPINIKDPVDVKKFIRTHSWKEVEEFAKKHPHTLEWCRAELLSRTTDPTKVRI